ncbi:MAG: T9SS type A sorting domain-containing protein, partial [Flavobacteriales bacterium]
YVVAGWSENFGPGFRSMYVVKTDSVGQTSSLDVDVYFDPINVWESANASSIIVYPNPVLTPRAVQVSGVPSGVHLIATAFDPIGRLVRQWGLDPDSRTIDLNGLAPGSYHLVLSSKQGVVHSATLIVQ